MVPPSVDTDLPAIVEKIRHRARYARITGLVMILVSSAVAIAIIVIFVLSIRPPRTMLAYGLYQAPPLEPLEPMPEPSQDGERTPGDELRRNIERLEKHATELSETVDKNAQLANDTFEAFEKNFEILGAITLAIVRLGSVVIAFYIVQVLVHFTRYQFRMADHLHSVADAIMMAQGEWDNFAKIVACVSPQHIVFGKAPATPTEKALDTVRDIASKIPKQ